MVLVGNLAGNDSVGSAITIYSDVTPTLVITDSVFSGNMGGNADGSANTTVCIQADSVKGIPKLTGVVGLTPTVAPFPSISGWCSQYMTQA